MSISSELVSLFGDLNDAEAKIVEKGGTVTHSGTSYLASNIDTIPQGGETYVKTYDGDGGRILDVSDLPNGLFHGHKQETPTLNTDSVGFYVLKQGLLVSYMIMSKAGNYRNYVSQDGKINSNSANFLFTGKIDVYKVLDLEY